MNQIGNMIIRFTQLAQKFMIYTLHLLMKIKLEWKNIKPKIHQCGSWGCDQSTNESLSEIVSWKIYYHDEKWSDKNHNNLKHITISDFDKEIIDSNPGNLTTKYSNEISVFPLENTISELLTLMKITWNLIYQI